MTWKVCVKLKGNWLLHQQTGSNYTIHMALCKVTEGHCVYSCDHWQFLLTWYSQATTTTTDSTLETETADSEPVASPSQEYKAATAELLGALETGNSSVAKTAAVEVLWHVGSVILIFSMETAVSTQIVLRVSYTVGRTKECNPSHIIK